MANKKTTLIIDYFHKVKSSNKELTKKEAFKDLLNRLYSEDKELRNLIDKITLGAEKTVVNIPRKEKLHKGSADTLYNKIIIEFENDLKVTLNHAKEQLAGYLLGQLRSGEGYNFTLIASDFISWKVFAPDVNQLDKIENLQEHELILNEAKSASFVLTERNAEEFYYWIDRFLFKEEKQRATLKRIEEAFGYQSNIFIESFRELNKWFNEAKKFGEVQVSFEQWSKFLSIAYGGFDARDNIFLIHTYLSVFSKMLAYSVVSNDDYIDDSELKGILDGSIFHRYNIRNFVDNDFFHWVNTERSFNNLKKVFRLIAQEISNFEFDNVDEDILKGVYQELIDIDTRHSLGEYYTPDWLCERIVKEFDFSKTDKILDPACGSGSFLRAAIHRIKELNPGVTVEELNEQIYGIDIHPLSVQIAKTTLLLALGKEIINAKKPVYLNIILANTLLASNPQFRAVVDNLKDIKNYNRYRTYIQDNFKVTDRFTFQPGLRLDYYNILNKAYVAPRLSISYAFDELTTLRAAWGLYFQSPGYEKLRDEGILYDLSDQYTSSLVAEKAIHYVLGVERWLTGEWSVRVESYYKDFENLFIPEKFQGERFYTEQIPGKDPRFVSGWTLPATFSGDSLTQIPINGSYGEAYGFEFFLSKKSSFYESRFSGWVSYALAYANRYENGTSGALTEGIKYPFNFDQRHTVNIVLNYQLNSWLEFGVRWQYGSGFPISQPAGVKPRIILEDQDLDGTPETPVIATRDLNNGGEDPVIFDVDFADRKLNSRKPIYHRLDLRINAFAGWWDLDWTIYLDVINVYNHSNVIGYDYYVNEDLTLGRETTTMLPIIPTLGFSVRF